MPSAIGQIPHLLIRWGLTIIFFIVIGLLFLSWVIRYPDTITIQVKIKRLNFEADSKNINSEKIYYIGEALVNESLFGKIQAGQDTNIKLISYPFAEYGIISGTIESVSEIPVAGTYKVNIILPDDLRTSFGKNLKYYQGMNGEAEIILEELRLIEKFLSGLRIFHVKNNEKVRKEQRGHEQ